MSKSKSIGNRFQQDFEKSIPNNLYYRRLRDVGSGSNGRFFRRVDNEGDYIIFNGNILVIFELKSTNSKSLPLSNIRMGQIWKMLENVVKKNTFGGLLIELRKYNECYFIFVEDFIYWYLFERNRKSLPYSWIKKYGYKVPRQIKRVRYKYDVQKLLNWIEVSVFDKENLRKGI